MRSVRLAATTIAALLAAGCSASRGLTAPGAPPALKVAAGERLSLEAFASGVQLYACGVDGRWLGKGAEAELADRDGRRIGRHYAGPTWEAGDGSKVTGEIRARENARSADDVPWLLLRAVSSSGYGTLGRTTSIQRMDTVGGTAPAGRCTEGAQARVPYKATYYFYRR